MLNKILADGGMGVFLANEVFHQADKLDNGNRFGKPLCFPCVETLVPVVGGDELYGLFLLGLVLFQKN